MPDNDGLTARVRQVKVLMVGIRVFGSARAFLAWLNTPCLAFEDREPLSLLASPEGIIAVETVLDMIAEGFIAL